MSKLKFRNQYIRKNQKLINGVPIGVEWTKQTICICPESVAFEEFHTTTDQNGDELTMVQVVFKTGDKRLLDQGVHLTTNKLNSSETE